MASLTNTNSQKQIKLTYFTCYGRAELTRLCFAYGNIKYEDNRVNGAEFQQFKATTPFGQLPMLNVVVTSNNNNNNKKEFQVSQSHAIAKYAARMANLYPKQPSNTSNEMEMICDMIEFSTEDVRSKLIPIRYSGKQGDARLQLYDNFYENVLPTFLTKFSNILGENLYFTGDSISMADIAFLNMCLFCQHPCCKDLYNSKKHCELQSNALDEFPTLKALKQRVMDIPSIQNYLRDRPYSYHDNIMEKGGDIMSTRNLSEQDNLLYSDARKQFPRGVRVTSIRIVNKQRIDAYVPDAYTDNILSFIKNDTNGEWSTSNGNKDYDVNEVDPAEFDVRDKIKYATRYWIVL